MIADLAERATGPKPESFPGLRFGQGWVAERALDEMRARTWDDAWRLIEDGPAERDRVVALFAGRPSWAPLVARLLDERFRTARARAPEPEVAPAAVERALKRAEAEFETVIGEMRLSRRDSRKALREAGKAHDIYWGRQPRAKDIHRHVRIRAKQLAVAAHRAGCSLPLPELVELATRLLYWGTATMPYPHGWRPANKPSADVGGEVRAAVTEAFARLLPDPMRAVLELDGQHLHRLIR